MAMISAGTKILLDEEELHFCESTPELGATPSEVEVTALENHNKLTVPGIKEFDSMDFTFFYDTEQFKKLHPLCDNQTDHVITVEFPDGLKIKLTGKLSVALSSAAVNEALKYTLTVSLSADVETVLPE
jgi:hypothetical protein